MKVLFDCIVTQAPGKCSTTVQFITLAEMLLEIPDVFIYWPIPDRFDAEDMEALPQSDRIQYIPLPQSKDRMKEYNRVHKELDDIVSFNGPTWDWDVLVTVRSTMVSIMKTISLSPRQKSRFWTKRIVLIEDMMVLSKKPTVAQSVVDVQDRMTLEGYLAADKVLIPAYHETAWVMEIARKHLSAGSIKEIKDKIREVCHLNMPAYKLKSPKHKYNPDRKMNVAFVGRMEKASARLTSINAILRNQFIVNSGKVHPFICTVSDGPKGINTKAIEMRYPKRKEFHRICREEMDLAIFFTVDVELNMSMLEPISMGVPIIVKREKWSEAMVGEDYPFLVTGESQAFALISAFQKDYDKMYAVFAKWFKEWFVPTYEKRSSEDGMYKHLVDFILNGGPCDEECQRLLGSLGQNEIVRLMVEHGGDEFVMFDLIEKLGDTVLRTLADKVKEGDRDNRGLVWSTPWNDFRLALQQFYGYKDASVKVGHLIRSQA